MIRIWNVLQGHGKYLLCYIILAAVLPVTNPGCDDLLTNSHEIRSVWASHIHDAEICSTCFEMSGAEHGNFMLPTNVLFGLKVSQSEFNLETHPIYRQISGEILKLLVTISYFLKCWLASEHLIERGLIRLLSLGRGIIRPDTGDIFPLLLHLITSDPENVPISWQNMLWISDGPFSAVSPAMTLID